MSLLRPSAAAREGGRGSTSTQAAHVAVEAIEGGAVRLVGGHYRAVLEIGSLSLALQGPAAQEATLAGYAAFLNGLSYPVQILVRLLPVELDGYIVDLEQRAQHLLPEPLATVARDHSTFARRLARERTLLERRFYLVVPADGAPRLAQSGAWPVARFAHMLPFWRHGGGRAGTHGGAHADALAAATSAADAAEATRRQLEVRCEEVTRQLARCELTARRLDGRELTNLLYSCWCPESAHVQRLQRPLPEHMALVVQGAWRQGAAGSAQLAGGRR
jgi:hypothetical protein